MTFKYVFNHMNKQKKLENSNSCNNLYKDYRKKRQATKYIIGGKQYHSIYVGYVFSYIFTPVEQIVVKI